MSTAQQIAAGTTRTHDHTAPPVVATGDLVVGYAGEPVVAGISVAVRPGESLALVGINGSGKSTLLKTLVGLLPALGGMATVFGEAPGRAARRIAYLGQARASSFLLPLRASDIVQMGCYPRRGLFGRITADDRALVRAAMETMGVAHLADAPLRALSGGQQQRVYLAHALARQADVLLLDEPTAGLDAHAQERYVSLIAEERARGAAVVIATHDVRDAARADHVLLLAGRVVAAGPPFEVLRPERLSEAFGITLVAVPHGDHHDLLETGHAHGHGERTGHDHPERQL